MTNKANVGPLDLQKTAEILLARRIQLSERLKELERAIDDLDHQERRLRPGAKPAKQVRHLDENYLRLVGNATKMHAEAVGELCEVSGLLRALPIRQQRTAVDVEKVRALVRQHDLFELVQTTRQRLYEQNVLGDTAFCEVCITACTECVTSCASDCITACTSECIGACTACSPSDVTGCIDTLGMQSLFDKPEKTGDPVELQLLADRVEIEW
jgi:hypothetical protein